MAERSEAKTETETETETAKPTPLDAAGRFLAGMQEEPVVALIVNSS